MKMVEKKALFSLKYKQDIIEGKAKVVTENDLPVKIVHWNANKDFPILGLITLEDGNVEPRLWSEEGKRQFYMTDNFRWLYLLVEEPELTEFENTLVIELMKFGVLTTDTDLIAYTSKSLLDAARKQIMDEWSKGVGDVQDRSGKAYNDGYNEGIIHGINRAKNDMPRWKKLQCGYVAAVCDGNLHFGVINTVELDGYYLTLDDLKKLPKEENV